MSAQAQDPDVHDEASSSTIRDLLIIRVVTGAPMSAIRRAAARNGLHVDDDGVVFSRDEMSRSSG